MKDCNSAHLKIIISGEKKGGLQKANKNAENMTKRQARYFVLTLFNH